MILKSDLLKTNFYIDPALPLDYNLTLFHLVLFMDCGLIDIFEFNEALVNLRKRYNLPYINPYINKGDKK